MSEQLRYNYINFINEIIKSQAIPTLKFLIKDNKKPDKNGIFPTRLVVSAAYFTSAFPKFGCIGIK